VTVKRSIFSQIARKGNSVPTQPRTFVFIPRPSCIFLTYSHFVGEPAQRIWLKKYCHSIWDIYCQITQALAIIRERLPSFCFAFIRVHSRFLFFIRVHSCPFAVPVFHSCSFVFIRGSCFFYFAFIRVHSRLLIMKFSEPCPKNCYPGVEPGLFLYNWNPTYPYVKIIRGIMRFC